MGNCNKQTDIIFYQNFNVINKRIKKRINNIKTTFNNYLILKFNMEIIPYNILISEKEFNENIIFHKNKYLIKEFNIAFFKPKDVINNQEKKISYFEKNYHNIFRISRTYTQKLLSMIDNSSC
jgi:hypothetical protein